MSGMDWKSTVTLVSSIGSWSHFHVKASVFPLSNMMNLPRRCQSCLGQEKWLVPHSLGSNSTAGGHNLVSKSGFVQ